MGLRVQSTIGCFRELFTSVFLGTGTCGFAKAIDKQLCFFHFWPVLLALIIVIIIIIIIMRHSDLCMHLHCGRGALGLLHYKWWGLLANQFDLWSLSFIAFWGRKHRGHYLFIFFG